MEKHNIILTSADIMGLWKSYIQNTAALCITKHFMQHVQDKEIKHIIKEQIGLLESYIKETTKIFNEENFPIPKGFSDNDVDLSAPALYTDLFALSFIYRYNQILLSDSSTIYTKVARADVVDFFEYCVETATKLYKKALNLMFSKGIYDRPPKISYPDKVHFIEKQESLLASFIGEHRPLNVIELDEIFFTIERNLIGMDLLMGFIQVMKDKEIKEFLIKGKELAQRQVDMFNKILIDEEHHGTLPVTMEVTGSTVSPFSDRLITFFIASTASTGLYLVAYSMANALRKDLIAKYSLVMAEIMKYSGDGLKLMIDRGWMEQPPQAFDRVAALKG